VKQYIEAGKEVKQYFEVHKKVKQCIQTNVSSSRMARQTFLKKKL
jgi:hypothetical protein